MNYNYLGTCFKQNFDSSQEIRIVIEKARSTVIRMKHVFSSPELGLQVKIRLMISETLRKNDMKKLEAFEP